jgi:HEAT repeat protein
LSDVLRDTKRGRELASAQRSSHQPAHWRTRAFAAYGLGLIGYRSEDEGVRREIVRSLAAMLDGEATAMATPDVAVACLISMGLVPLPVELDYLPRDDGAPPPDRCRQAQIDWVLHLLERENLNHLVRAHATTTLARLVARVPDGWGLRRRAADRLLAAIAPHSPESREVRASAVLALGRIGGSGAGALDRSIRASLVKAFAEAREPDVKNFALVALAHIAARPGPGEAEPLEGLKETQAFLLKELAKGSTTDRPWIVLALGVLDRGSIDIGVSPSPEIGVAVRAALKEARSPRDVGACAIAVGIRDDAESRAELVAKLGEVSDDETRGFVALALGLMGARDAIGRIQDIVADAKYRDCSATSKPCRGSSRCSSARRAWRRRRRSRRRSVSSATRGRSSRSSRC